MGHPDDASQIEFDDANEAHLARHRITPSEVFEVWENDPLWAANKKDRTAGWLMIGRTDGNRPLVIAVLYDERRGSIRPITGRTCAPHEVTKWKV